MGRSANNRSLVTIGGGTMIMNEGSKITGNTNTTGTTGLQGGGGVRVSSGIFIMNGGEISGNTTTNVFNDGGGVRIFSEGTFYMHGGRIFGNNARFGGGVDNRGSFLISGGTIFGNVANQGAALYVHDATISAHGIFSNGNFIILDILNTTDDTIYVIDGVLQQ
jgi:cytoskeletal protein CcmA (bactofilin family)